MNGLKNKVILITGGTGSIGKELVRQVLREKPAQVRVFSRDESKQYELDQELGHPKNLRLLIGDVRDKDRLLFAFKGVDVVFHAAALKHVPSCEYNPFEAIRTNVMGSQNVIDAAIAHNVDRVVAISTDKTVNPTSVMGISKLLMERLVINANYYKGGSPIKFSCVRFGNVAWSRGSVLPLWKNQAEKKGEITITNDAMTRFFMSIKDAVGLVIESSRIMQGGEIFILKMPAITLAELATEFIRKYFPHKKIKIKKIGNRAGEKLHEELISSGDDHVLENKHMFISIPNIWQHLDMEARERTYSGFKVRVDTDSYQSSEHIQATSIRTII